MSSRHTDIITWPVRRVLEDEIERLIAMLDEIDGDADFEPDADTEDGSDAEPWLGALENATSINVASRHEDGRAARVVYREMDQSQWSGSGSTDLELDDCDDEDTHDREEVCEDEGAQCDDEGFPEYAYGPDREEEAI